MILRIVITFLLLALASCALAPRPLTADDLSAVNDPSPEVLAKVESNFLRARDLNQELESRILLEGTRLSAEQIDMARALGVQDVNRVRVLYSTDIPGNPSTRLGKLFNFYVVAAVTSGYGIIIHPDYSEETWILAHELVHVAQFERLGFDHMVRQRLTETYALPGRLVPLEREAIQKSTDYLGADVPAYAF